MREENYEWADPEDPQPPHYKSKVFHVLYLAGIIIAIPIMALTWPWWGYEYYKHVMN